MVFRSSGWFCDQVPTATSMAFASPSEVARVPRSAEVHVLRRSTQATDAAVAGFHPHHQARVGCSTSVISSSNKRWRRRAFLRIPLQKLSMLYILRLSIECELLDLFRVDSPCKLDSLFLAPCTAEHAEALALFHYQFSCSCRCCCLLDSCFPVFSPSSSLFVLMCLCVSFMCPVFVPGSFLICTFICR